jgi:hypothetical protein
MEYNYKCMDSKIMGWQKGRMHWQSLAAKAQELIKLISCKQVVSKLDAVRFDSSLPLFYYFIHIVICFRGRVAELKE